jgi:hypothetical protein
MRLNFSTDRLTETLGRVGHAIERGLALTEALIGLTVGTGVALVGAALLRMTDAGLARLFANSTCPTCTPLNVQEARTMLLVFVFGGLIWAATACRKTREWFKPASNGGAS